MFLGVADANLRSISWIVIMKISIVVILQSNRFNSGLNLSFENLDIFLFAIKDGPKKFNKSLIS